MPAPSPIDAFAPAHAPAPVPYLDLDALKACHAALVPQRQGPVWIDVVPAEVFAAEAAASLAGGGPLAGKVFAVKDNIDATPLPTTAGCPAYRYETTADNPVVGHLRAAGAILLGKTTLDQFATGLVGTRSPFGLCRNVLNPDYISGGSSSGSAVAVASGQADFALGTDTAGSGRVPCVLNGIVGYKPTKGLLSTRHAVPACRSLDCITLMAKTVAELRELAPIVRQYDPQDPMSRPWAPVRDGRGQGAFTFAVPRPDQLQFFGDDEAAALYRAACEKLSALGGTRVEVDYAPFAETAALLYQGPWVAERYAAVGAWLEEHHAEADPTVAKIILGGRDLKAAAVYQAMLRLAELRLQSDAVFATVDFLVVPTVPSVYTLAEVQANPIELNTRLGTYNNFVNLLDLAAVAVPAGRWSHGVGFGLNLIAPAFADDSLLDLAGRFLGEPVPPRPSSPEGPVHLAVVGAHLAGQPLHGQLSQLGARLVARTQTAAAYRLHALANTSPPKPGLERVGADGEGAAIAVEVYELSITAFGRFTAGVPAPMVIGNVELADGRWVKGFLCEPCALAGAEDISAFGGWLAWLGRSA
jgi:allophanate hydrolase